MYDRVDPQGKPRRPGLAGSALVSGDPRRALRYSTPLQGVRERAKGITSAPGRTASLGRGGAASRVPETGDVRGAYMIIDTNEDVID